MITINGHELTYTAGTDNDAAMHAFNKLMIAAFGLDLTGWLATGYHKSRRFVPHLLMHEGKAVCALTVNHMSFSHRGDEKNYVQIGCVATAESWQGQGLSRWLMERALGQCQKDADGVYLLANDSVLGFYPKFGFRPAPLYTFTRPLPVAPPLPCRRLDLTDPTDEMLLWSAHAAGAPFSAFSLQYNEALAAFHLYGSLRGSLYHFPATGAVVAAQEKGSILTISEVLGGDGTCFDQMATAIASPAAHTLRLGFTPLDATPYTATPLEGKNTTLFLLGANNSPFEQEPITIPDLSIG